jgi:hypothetical protein
MRNRLRISLILAGILSVKLIFQILVLRSGFISVSGDDFYRALIAYEWSKAPFISSTAIGSASVLWLPFHYYLVGVVLKIFPEVWLAPILVSLTFSLLTLLMIFFVARKLVDATVGLLAVVMAAFFPWEVWLSVSGIAATIYQFFILTGLYFTIKWRESLRSLDLFLASGAFLCTTMLRPEGWFFTLIFSGYIGFHFLQLWKQFKRHHKLMISLAILLPWSFIAYWLYFNYTAYGDMLYFVTLSKENYQIEAREVDSLAIRLFQYPFILFVVSPTLFVLSILSLAGILKRRTQARNIYVLFVLSTFALQILASINGSGTNSTPQRYVVMYVILFIPLIASLLWRCLKRWGRKGSVFLAIGFLLFLSYNLVHSFEYSRDFEDEAKVGKFLRKMWEKGKLQRTDVICTERTFRGFIGLSHTDFVQETFSLVNKWGIQVLSNHPDNFVMDLTKDFSINVKDTYVASNLLESELQRNRVKILVLHAPDVIKKIPNPYKLVKVIGKYRLFSDTKNIFGESLYGVDEGDIEKRFHETFGNQLVFHGYTLSKGSFPGDITLFWEIISGAEENYIIRLELIREGQHVILTDEIPSYQDEKLPERVGIINNTINFPRTTDFIPDYYMLKLSVSKTDYTKLPLMQTSGAMQETTITLGKFPIIPSKRSVIKRLAKGERTDLRLFLRVLLTL